MKTCSICKEDRPLSDYLKHDRSSDGLGYRCKTCRSVKGKERYTKKKESGWLEDYQEKNKERISESNIRYQRKNTSSAYKQSRKLQMCEYKGGLCISCGFKANELTLSAFDFHHLDPEEKEKGLSDMIMGKWEKITKELDKCVLLSSNCHRIHHHGKSIEQLIPGWDEL